MIHRNVNIYKINKHVPNTKQKSEQHTEYSCMIVCNTAASAVGVVHCLGDGLKQRPYVMLNSQVKGRF